MRHSLRRSILYIVASSALIFGSACDRSPGESARIVRDGTLVAGLKSEPDSLNPYLARVNSALIVANRVLPQIATERLPSGSQPAGFDPSLATGWEWKDEGKTLVVSLAPKGAWSDGQPIGCADLQFTLKAQTSSEVAWRQASIKRHITSIDCPGPLSAEVHFDRAYPALLQLMDLNDINLLPASLASTPFSQWRQVDWGSRLPAGGAFKFERAVPGQDLVLVRNDQYFGAPTRPYLKKLVLRALPDGQARLAAFRAGDIQVMEDLQPADLPQLATDPALRVERRAGWSYSYLGWNLVDPQGYAEYREKWQRACGANADCPEDTAALAAWLTSHPHPLFGDRNVRMALTLGIDRQGMIDALLQAEGEVPATPFLAPLPEHDMSLAPPPLDRARAKSLLAAAGWSDSDGDGTLDRGGKKFAFHLLVQAGNGLRKAAAQWIQSDLAKLGIAVTIDPIENSSFYQTLDKREMDAWVAGWTVSLRADPNENLHITAARIGGNNYGGWTDPIADDLASRARDTQDDQARYKLWHEWERSFLEQEPYTMLFRPRSLTGVRRDIEGTASLTAGDLLNGVEGWWQRGP